jgi:hypothetical protein
MTCGFVCRYEYNTFGKVHRPVYDDRSSLSLKPTRQRPPIPLTPRPQDHPTHIHTFTNTHAHTWISHLISGRIIQLSACVRACVHCTVHNFRPFDIIFHQFVRYGHPTNGTDFGIRGSKVKVSKRPIFKHS